MFVDESALPGRLAGPDHALSEEDLGMLIIDEFIRFPKDAHLSRSLLRGCCG